MSNIYGVKTEEMASDDEIPDLFPAEVDPVDQQAGRGSTPLPLIPTTRNDPAPPGRAAGKAPVLPESAARTQGETSALVGGNLAFGDEWDAWEGAAFAQLNVDVSERSREEEEVPWPTAVTPSLDELAIDPAQASLVAGFGPAPRSVFLAPLYAVRVMHARRRLREKERLSCRALTEAARSRDENLAALAQEKRASLKENERFSRLYDEVERQEETTLACRAAFQQTDAAGARALAEIEAKISGLVAERNERQRVFEEQQSVLHEAERGVSRARAALKKIDIQWRNVESRARTLPGKEMPAELDRELDTLEEQKREASSALQTLQEARSDIARQAASQEDELRLAAAAVRRAEGEKEALLLTQQGEISKQARELDEALGAQRDALAAVARAIVRLRGEVPVSIETRRSLLRSDEAVLQAASELQTIRRAQLTVDEEAWGRGRMALGLLVLAVLVGAFVLVVT